MRMALVMPAPLTSQQIELYMKKRRIGSAQEAAAAAAGLSVRSARRIDTGGIQAQAGKPRGRTAPIRWRESGRRCCCRCLQPSLA